MQRRAEEGTCPVIKARNQRASKKKGVHYRREKEKKITFKTNMTKLSYR